VFVSQPVIADRGPCRDLLRRLPWDKTFRLTEKKRKATCQNPHGKSTVAVRKYIHATYRHAYMNVYTYTHTW